MSTESETPTRQSWWTWIILLPLLYVLSCGPVAGFVYWLEERTGDSEISSMLLDIVYWPLVVEWPVGEEIKQQILFNYVGWWTVVVFQAEIPIIIPVGR